MVQLQAIFCSLILMRNFSIGASIKRMTKYPANTQIIKPSIKEPTPCKLIPTTGLDQRTIEARKPACQ